MKTIKFTDEELKVLNYVIFESSCTAGCICPEIQNSNIDCDECPFTKVIQSIEEKIKNR